MNNLCDHLESVYDRDKAAKVWDDRLDPVKVQMVVDRVKAVMSQNLSRPYPYSKSP